MPKILSIQYQRIFIKKVKTMSNAINPNYYKKGNVEAFDFIMECVKFMPPKEACCVKDIMKYVIRYNEKNGVEDLEKAKWYLTKLIEIVEERK